jgi:Zn-dependent protease
MSAADPPPPRGAVRVARVAGVPVYVGRGWLLLAAFVAWTGWSNNRDLSTGTAVAYAATLVVSILVAVLGHEVAHALSARALGLQVHRIVADLWGGHTAFDGTGVTPGRNAVVSASGPLANLAMAGAGAAVVAALPEGSRGFAWPFVVLNLLLGGFNLLPGLPLDGGQLVHSLVWAVSGRRDLGLLVAGWCGRVVAVVVVLWFGVRPALLGSADLFQVGLALVMAWLLWSGATAAIRRAPLDRLLDRVRPEDLMEPVVVVPLTTTLEQVRGLGRRVVALDDRGRPTLVLPGRLPGTPDPTPPGPGTALSSMVVRLPDECVVEIAPGGSAEPVLRSMAATGWGLVIVTTGGTARGAITSERLNAVARSVTGRN